MSHGVAAAAVCGGADEVVAPGAVRGRDELDWGGGPVICFGEEAWWTASCDRGSLVGAAARVLGDGSLRRERREGEKSGVGFVWLPYGPARASVQTEQCPLLSNSRQNLR